MKTIIELISNEVMTAFKEAGVRLDRTGRKRADV